MPIQSLKIGVPFHHTDPSTIGPGVTERDQVAWKRAVNRQLSKSQIELVTSPAKTYPHQFSVLAVHWHPEFVPMAHIRTRLEAAFPNRQDELVIPTQHNELVQYDGFIGAEIDCFSGEINRKVQFLLHFEASRLESASTFKRMLHHTYQYRRGQLYDYIDTILEPKYQERLREAAIITGSDDDLVEFVRILTRKLRDLMAESALDVDQEVIRNKLVRDFFNAQRANFDAGLINHAQVFLKAVKEIVKQNFTMEYFYEARDVIEEVRGLGGGIIVPHPEQFWPVLLCDFDVDGIEVWNPQSQDFTKFLIQVVTKKNQSRASTQKPILILMGDDCHMGEKVKEADMRDTEKAAREIGVQPWEDPTLRKELAVANCDRQTVIQAYRERLQS